MSTFDLKKIFFYFNFIFYHLISCELVIKLCFYVRLSQSYACNHGVSLLTCFDSDFFSIFFKFFLLIFLVYLPPLYLFISIIKLVKLIKLNQVKYSRPVFLLCFVILEILLLL